MTIKQLNTRTPTVVVHDNRGSTIREISYCRHPDTINKTDERITRHHYHARGYLEHSIDARLYEAQQSDSTVQSNIQQTVSLGGALSLSQGVDNGNSFNLNDIEGAILQQINAKGTVTIYEYTDPRFERNLDNIKEGKLGENRTRVVQKFKWAQAWDEFITKNQVGKCIEHFDIAGKKTADSFSLLGGVLSETQQLYFGREIDLSSNNDVSKIENSEKYTTQYTYDATGTVLTETDCKGHQRRMIYDIAGFVKQSWLTLKGQSEQIILRSLTYSAAGQKLREEQGNGLVTTYEYEPETQRLLHIKTARLQGHALGAKIMQDLRYEYDPVGNIICLKNDAEATRYWRNQKVVPENRYVYDSLYQLVSATGRESANQQTPAAMQSQLITTLVKDTQSYTNYTRLYAYDRGGNLTQIRHNSSIAQQSFTQDIVVSNKTNRALLKSQCEDPKKVDSYFDESGNLIKLLNGDAIIWDERNHLKATNQVIESGFLYEGETYQYNNTGQRVTKIRGRKAAYGHLEKVTTHYLPNIEIWEVNEDPVAEKYIVAQVNAGTRAGVRALCWEIGSPKGIENNSLRYNYDDGMGNSGLETDGQGQLVSYEEYYPYGGTAIWSSENAVEADYKTIRYSGKEKDSTGMYYYGYRYYQPWIGRWLSADPAGTIDGLNLYRMVRNNPVTLHDPDGRMPNSSFSLLFASDDMKLQKGSITPLRNRGLFVGSNKESSEATLPFAISRFDSVEHNPVLREYSPELLKRGGDLYQSVHIFRGSQVTSQKPGVGTVGTYWGRKTLFDDLTAIYVTNGRSGSVGISIQLDDIQEKKPIVITSGALSGCTMQYAVDKEKFYAVHTGQKPGDDSWKTGIQGVSTTQHSFRALSDKNLSVSGNHNNDLIGTLSEFERSVITYLGKQGTRIDQVQENVAVFDYNNQHKVSRFEPRAGYSYALLARDTGKVNVKVLSEDVTINKNTSKITVLDSMKVRLH
ncbi:cytotoxic necrotizing factor Rho-activating domain-containing protein [Proteus vulgaris]|uniref:cytotoxic necrotizing factor Rho-activating domain-containing protein n=1 Tax=Proteus vulgaris TaxID=585 RepID=UPI00254128CF|nr:cytotoxic necrotizing factor Rho-activating domain-containing protein [Proteus vulgaris]WIF71885.1 cytotoxic necrotizing factor Rho-activating domain-containing protein [Proteus vulgaris]